MKYYTYWSLSDLPSNSIKSFEVCIWTAIICLILWALAKRFKKQDKNYEKAILLWTTGVVFCFSSVMFVYLKFYTKDETEQRIQKMLASNYVGTVEGEISNFKSVQPASRKGAVTVESFSVDSVDFSYEDAMLGRFNRFCKTNNGVFRNGLQVRITYGKGNHDILKVEIAK